MNRKKSEFLVTIIVVFFVSIIQEQKISAEPSITFPSSIYLSKKNWYYNPYADQIQQREILTDSTYVVEINSPLYECRENSPLSRAIDKYLDEFEIFLSDTINAAKEQLKKPFITAVSIDENPDGSYFCFDNYNSFCPRYHTLFKTFCHIVYKGHIFFLSKSLYSNIVPTGTEEPVFVKFWYVEEHNTKTKRYSKKNNSNQDEYLKRLTVFIPWRDCVD